MRPTHAAPWLGRARGKVLQSALDFPLKLPIACLFAAGGAVPAHDAKLVKILACERRRA